MKLSTIVLPISLLGLVACSAPAPEHVAKTGSKLSDTGTLIVGAYHFTNAVSGNEVWKSLDLLADGTFGAFAPCKVPACTAFRQTGTFDVQTDDSGNQTLVLSAANGQSYSYALTLGWDGAQGLELVTDAGDDEQLSYVAGSCRADADCAGQSTIDATSGTCASGTVASCAVNECQTQCAPSNPALAQRGAACGGFVANAKQCAAGLVCITSSIPDKPGTCEPEGTPSSCQSDFDCFDDQQSCFTTDSQCGGAGRCATRPTLCPHVCGATSVCGCDGVTYCNACLAASGGVSIATNGACATN